MHHLCNGRSPRPHLVMASGHGQQDQQQSTVPKTHPVNDSVYVGVKEKGKAKEKLINKTTKNSPYLDLPYSNIILCDSIIQVGDDKRGDSGQVPGPDLRQDMWNRRMEFVLISILCRRRWAVVLLYET